MIDRSNLFELVDMHKHIHNSNLIESVDDPFENKLSALAWKYRSAQDRLTKDVVLEVHRIIMLNSLPIDQAGSLRMVDVRVGWSICPDPYEVPVLLTDWLRDMRSYRTSYKKWGPREMHVRFEKIHPFIDGNGRTGRMLMWWHEMKLGRRPTLIKFEDRGAYYQWFRNLPA
jgi:Fic family protein